ncbi:hypothetical protein FOZ62_017805, partial [Perkinsus olseni]
MSIDEWNSAVRKSVRRYVRSVIETFDPSTGALHDGSLIPPGFALSSDGTSLYVADKSWSREGRTAKQARQQQASSRPVHTELLYNVNATGSSDASLDSSPRDRRSSAGSGAKRHSGRLR